MPFCLSHLLCLLSAYSFWKKQVSCRSLRLLCTKHLCFHWNLPLSLLWKTRRKRRDLWNAHTQLNAYPGFPGAFVCIACPGSSAAGNWSWLSLISLHGSWLKWGYKHFVCTYVIAPSASQPVPGRGNLSWELPKSTVFSSGIPNIIMTLTCWSESRGGCKDDQRAGTPLLWRQDEKVGVVQTR